MKWEKKARFDKKTKLYWFAPIIYLNFLKNIEIPVGYKRIKMPLIMQYYYYFAYNDYHWGVLPVPFLTHPHDWELIQIALDKDYQIISYSVSAHGTFLGISNKTIIDFYTKEGFRCNKGAHNFGSIFQTFNRPKKDDIKIEPNTLIPISDGKYISFKDSIILFDEEYKKDFLKKFTFYQVLAPWESNSFDESKWRPEFWSLSAFQRFIELRKEKKGYI